jgi:acetylornithine deacetylase/succinyl-diaminopimelate desuccinylase-like protein
MHSGSTLSGVPEPTQLERRTTELLQRLIRFNTVNPPGNEQAAQEFLRDTLEAAGFECELLSAIDGRPNLVARLRGDGDGPTLCLCGHVDTVLADPSDWSVDPWSGELKDGHIWGRGALDMKSQVAAEVAAAATLAEQGWRPAGELLVVITADEESGAEYGAQWLCTEHPDKVRCDFMINEGAGEIMRFNGRQVYGVCVAEKGVFRFTLTTHGQAGHASIPRVGDNALTKLAPLLQAMRDRQPSLELSPEPESLLTALGIDPSEPASALREAGKTDPRVAILLEPLLGVTLTPTMVHASDKINVIPAQASLKVDCRVPPGLGRDHALEKIREVLGDDGWSIEFNEEVVGNRSPIETPLMDAIRGWVEQADPEAAVAATSLPGFTDSRWWREAFPDCVAYGFFPQRAMDLFEAVPLVHGADERVPVADLGFAADAYAHICRGLLS